MLLIIFAILVIVGGGYLIYKNVSKTQTDKAESVSTSFFENLYTKNDDSKQAYALTSKAMHGLYTHSEFTTKFSKSGFDYQSIKFSEVSIVGDNAGIIGVVKTKNGVSFNFNMKLVKESGNWKVFSFQLT